MLFTEKDIKQILGIIDTAVAKMVAETLGKDYLTQADLTMLKTGAWTWLN